MPITPLGLVGTGTATSAGTTLAINNTTGAAIPAGTLIQISVVWDSVSATSPSVSCSTIGGTTAGASHGLTSSGQSATAGSGIFHQCWRAVTVSSIASGATIATVTSNQSPTKRAGIAFGFSGATNIMRNGVANAVSATNGALLASTPGTYPVAGDVVVFTTAFENNAFGTQDTDTLNGSWSTFAGVTTSGGSAATNLAISSIYKVVTADGMQNASSSGANDSAACIVTYTPAPTTHTAAVTFDISSTYAGNGKIPGEWDYFSTDYTTPGTFSSNLSAKALNIPTAQVGDLIVAYAHGALYNSSGFFNLIFVTSGKGNITTSVIGGPSLTQNVDPEVMGMYGIVTGVQAGGGIELTANLRVTATTPMGLSAWVIPAADIGATYGWRPGNAGFDNDADGQISVTVPGAHSTVLFMGSDLSPREVTGYNPSTPKIRNWVEISGTKTLHAEWNDQAAGTRDYGPIALLSQNWVGNAFVMEGVVAAPVTHTGAVTFSATSTYAADRETKWLNRAVYQFPRDGNTTTAVDPTSSTNLVLGKAFIPTDGNLLVAVIEGAVTSTTPSGWTLPSGGSSIGGSGLYVWYRTATSGSNSFTTTHNGSNYPVSVAIYEFAAGTTFVSSVATSGISSGAANPNLTGLTGTNFVMAAKAINITVAYPGASYNWTGAGTITEDFDLGVSGSPTDGYMFSIGYVEDYTGSSWQPSGSGITGAHESLTFAVKPPVTGPITHTGAVTFVATSTGGNASTAIKQVFASVTIPIVSTLGTSATAFKKVFASSTTPAITTYSAEGTVIVAPVTHTAAVTFTSTSAYSASGIRAAVASSTTPIVSTESATPKLITNASVTTAIVSVLVTQGIDITFGSVSTPVVSTYSAEGTVVVGSVTHTGSVTFTAVSTTVTSGIRVAIAADTTPIVSTTSATPKLITNASVTIPIVSTHSASGIDITFGSVTFPIISTLVVQGIDITFGSVSIPIVSTYAAQGELIVAPVTHTAAVTFTATSTYSASARSLQNAAVTTSIISTVTGDGILGKVASVTTPIVSTYSAAGIGFLNAAVSTPIVSALVAQGNKTTFGSTTTPITSIQVTAAGTVITQAASSTAIVSTTPAASGSVIPGPASVIIPIISTIPAANATRVVIASVTFAITSGMTVGTPQGIFAGASTTPIVSTTPSSTSTRLAIASVSTPLISTLTTAGVGIFQGQTNFTNIVSTFAANGNIPGSASTLTPVISTYAADGFVIRSASVTFAAISTMSANAVAKFMASSTTAIVSTTVVSGIRAAVASDTTPITSTYAAGGIGVFQGSTTTPIISTFASSAGTPPQGAVEIGIFSTYNANGYVVRQASVTFPIISTTAAAAVRVASASVTTPITSTYVGSGVKRVSAASTTAIVSTVVTQGIGIFRASSITSIVSDMMVAGSLVTFGQVVTAIISTYNAEAATIDLIKRLYPTILVELTSQTILEALTPAVVLHEIVMGTDQGPVPPTTKLTELTSTYTLKDVVQ